MFVNPVMRKVAALMSESNLAEDSIYHKAFLAKQNGEVTDGTSLFSVPGSVVVHPDRVLIKTSMDNSQALADRTILRRSKFPSLYTSGKSLW